VYIDMLESLYWNGRGDKAETSTQNASRRSASSCCVP
jgi:hypothetical protein